MSKTLRYRVPPGTPDEPMWAGDTYRDPRGLYSYSVCFDTLDGSPTAWPCIQQDYIFMEGIWVVIEPVAVLSIPGEPAGSAQCRSLAESVENGDVSRLEKWLEGDQMALEEVAERGGSDVVYLLRRCADALQEMNPTPEVSFPVEVDATVVAGWLAKFEDWDWEPDEEPPRPNRAPLLEHPDGESVHRSILAGGPQLYIATGITPAADLPGVADGDLTEVVLNSVPDLRAPGHWDVDTDANDWEPTMITLKGRIVGNLAGRLGGAGHLAERARSAGIEVRFPARPFASETGFGFEVAQCSDWDLDWWLKLDSREEQNEWTLSDMVWLKRSRDYQLGIVEVDRKSQGEIVDVVLKSVETPRGKYRGQPMIIAHCNGTPVGEISQQFRHECPDWMQRPVGSMLTVLGCTYPSADRGSLQLRVEYDRRLHQPVPDEWR